MSVKLRVDATPVPIRKLRLELFSFSCWLFLGCWWLLLVVGIIGIVGVVTTSTIGITPTTDLDIVATATVTEHGQFMR